MTAPKTPKEALLQAQAALKAGNADLAAELYRAVLARVPRHKAALKGLQRLEGRAQRPGISGIDIDGLLALLHNGQFAEAEQRATVLIQRDSSVSGLYNVRALAQAEQGKDEAALAGFRKAVLLDGRNYEALNNLGLKLRQSGQPEEARKALEKALVVQPGYPEAAHNLGTVLVELDEFAAAEAAFELAIKNRPGFAMAWCELGKLQALQGYGAAAIASLEQAIKLDPALVGAYAALAGLRRFEAGDPHISAMVRLAQAGHGNALEQAVLCFALGKAFEDAGAIDRAFGYYAQGNKLQGAVHPYDPAASQAEFKALKVAFAKAPASLPAAAKPPQPRPIFILGMNRSGTSLVEQILSCHSAVAGGGELEDFSRFAANHSAGLAQVSTSEMGRFRAQYLSRLRKIGKAENVTDKMPANFKYIGLIRQLFPDAPIICLEREARDLCFSNYKASVDSTGHMYSYDQVELARYYLLHQDLMAHWHGLFGDNLYRLSYEKLTAAPEAEIRALLDYCGLEWQEGVMAFHTSNRAVRTLSQSQVRQPINRGSVGAWRKFESHLGPMLEELRNGGAI